MLNKFESKSCKFNVKDKIIIFNQLKQLKINKTFTIYIKKTKKIVCHGVFASENISWLEISKSSPNEWINAIDVTKYSQSNNCYPKNTDNSVNKRNKTKQYTEHSVYFWIIPAKIA